MLCIHLLGTLTNPPGSPSAQATWTVESPFYFSNVNLIAFSILYGSRPCGASTCPTTVTLIEYQRCQHDQRYRQQLSPP